MRSFTIRFKEKMRTDPFYIKQYSKVDPRRLLPTLRNRWNNRIALRNHERYALPILELKDLPDLASNVNWQHTALTPLDMRYLSYICSLCIQNDLKGSFAEIGCYRGVTTRLLGNLVMPHRYYAIDPFSGYGGSQLDYEIFCASIDAVDNVIHFRQTSGDAYRSWNKGTLAFVFIDAIHDYPNASFDVGAWGNLLVNGGFLAAHDTDNPVFSGARRAVFEAANNRGFELFAHPANLTILRKIDHGL